jgi:hypothetical protein
MNKITVLTKLQSLLATSKNIPAEQVPLIIKMIMCFSGTYEAWISFMRDEFEENKIIPNKFKDVFFENIVSQVILNLL